MRIDKRKGSLEKWWKEFSDEVHTWPEYKIEAEKSDGAIKRYLLKKKRLTKDQREWLRKLK